MFHITNAQPIPAAKERIPSGAFDDFDAAMRALEAWRCDNGAAATTLLVLRGVAVVDSSGRRRWDEVNGKH